MRLPTRRKTVQGLNERTISLTLARPTDEMVADLRTCLASHVRKPSRIEGS